MYGTSLKNYGYRNIAIQAGDVIKDWNIPLKGFYGDANQSDGMLYSFYGDTIDLSKDDKGILTKHKRAPWFRQIVLLFTMDKP